MATEEVQEEGEAAEGQTNGTEDPIVRTQGVWLTSTPPLSAPLTLCTLQHPSLPPYLRPVRSHPSLESRHRVL